jgi:hypothetical protein
MLEKWTEVQIYAESTQKYVVKRICDAEKVSDKHSVRCDLITNHNISV